MKKALFKVFTVSILLTVSSCCRIDKGVVIDKEYVPTHLISEYNIVLKMLITRIVPDSYSITFKDSVYTREIHVSKEKFEKYKVGDSIYINLKKRIMP